jgi:centromere/kinetochore protein ZW10
MQGLFVEEISQSEIRKISVESAPEVDAWIKHAKAIQEDIDRSRNLASEIVRQAEAGEAIHAAVEDSGDRVDFLSKEARYNKQVGDALRGIKKVCDLLDQAEQEAVERKILIALHTLSSMNHK